MEPFRSILWSSAIAFKARFTLATASLTIKLVIGSAGSDQCRRHGEGGAAGGPCLLTTACAPPVWFTQHTCLEHHVTTRQQAIMEKGMITFKHDSHLKVSSIRCEIAANLLLCINATK